MAEQVTEKPEIAAATVAATDLTSKVEQPDIAAKPNTQHDDATAHTDVNDLKPAIADQEKKDVEQPTAEADSEIPDVAEAPSIQPAQPTADTTGLKIPATAGKNNRRKSSGTLTRKSLNKKASKARLTNLHAKPGDHFLVKLKGFPEWPAVICDESMLPTALLTTRPVTAAKPDGSYAEAYAEGGKRVNDRNFPVMYLSTNEFGWVINTALTELTPEMAEKAIDAGKKGKELKKAFELASEHHDLDHYKEILLEHEQQMIADEQARIAREEAKKAPGVTSKKSKKAKETEDLEMTEAGDVVKPKAKKRKADDEAGTPNRSGSTKKPKIKLNTSSTPKPTNGTSGKDSAASKVKPKSKKAELGKISPEERHARKEKEVLYLRHKLQRGLLTRDESPKADEMPQMAEYIHLLENFSDMEVSIIRATKINKVLKAILKLESIPRETEFNFKTRSQNLLEQWNKLMSTDGTSASVAPPNGSGGGLQSLNEGSGADEKAENTAVGEAIEGVSTGLDKSEQIKGEISVDEVQ